MIRAWLDGSNESCRRKLKIGIAITPLLLVFLLLAGCGEPQPIYVTLVVDGQDQLLEITAEYLAVRDLLEVTGITLGEADRIEPDLYVEVVDGMMVTITRVEQAFVTEREILTFSHQTIRSEAVPEGERRLLQTGANGEREITYQLTLEDGEEVAREEVRSVILAEPVDEIVLVGVQGELTSVSLSGTIVYLSGGNAWVMRESSDLRRNITGWGDLDGRVFALSPDGSRLLFTRGMVGDENAPLNSLWMARTSLVGEEPEYLGVASVVWGGWSPDGRQIAYSTAQRTGGVPGWKANNDLMLMTLPEEGSDKEAEIERVLMSTAKIPYAWWGRNFAWAPSGKSLAYAQANEVGVVDLASKRVVPLVSFPPYRTQSHWAWVPSVSWSPDGYLLAFVKHEGEVDGLEPEDSPIFGLWVASADGQVQVRLAEEVGMWAAPRFSPADNGQLSYGQAQSPRNSQDSRYDLFVMDRDGSNAQRLFPPEGLMGVIAPEVAWSITGDQLLLEYEGNLYRKGVEDQSLRQLTSDEQSTHPRWAQ